MRFNYKFLFCIFFIVLFVNGRAVFAQQVIPQIKRVQPAYGANDVDTLTPISISFNAQMNKKSIEKNFHIFPEVKGKFSWQGNTMIFKSQKPLLPSTSYFVSFTPNLKTTGGIPLSITYFNTPSEGVFVGHNGNLNIVSINAKVQELMIKGHNPVWARDNKSIIYDFEGAIWKVYSNGMNKEKISYDDETYKGSHPVCNPLTDLIAFIGTNSAGSANIYIIDMKTEVIQQLSVFYEPVDIKYLSWSPDGLYLAFLRAGQVWIMNNDGTNMKKLTNDELKCKENFAWSPGGTKIAFTGSDNVWIGDIYSTELRKMSFDDSETGILDWSQDNRIVFLSEGLTIMNADGSDEIKIRSAARNPVWINNGELLSFILPLHNDDNKSQLWIMDSKGENKKKIAIINSQQMNVSWSRNIGYWNLFSP